MVVLKLEMVSPIGHMTQNDLVHTVKEVTKINNKSSHKITPNSQRNNENHFKRHHKSQKSQNFYETDKKSQNDLAHYSTSGAPPRYRYILFTLHKPLCLQSAYFNVSSIVPLRLTKFGKR